MERGAEAWFSEAQPEPVLTDLLMTAGSVLNSEYLPTIKKTKTQKKIGV